MKRHMSLVLISALVASAGLSSCGGKGGDSDAEVPTDTVIDRFGTVTQTVGPNGERPTPVADVTLTDKQAAQIRQGGYRAAIAWHELSNWSQALQSGMESKFDELGVQVVSTTDAKFDAATRANQIESALALKPDVLLGQAVDPTTAAAAYQPAVDRGIKLIFADQAPDDYVYGDQYQAVMTDDLFQIGQRTGSAMCDAVGDTGDVAVLYYDAEFHVTNYRDAAFLSTLAEQCPEAHIIAKQGFSDPNKAEEIANALLVKHPDVDGIYISWAVPAQGVLAALKNSGNTDTKIVTVDLDDTIAADLAEGGNVAAMVADNAFEYGEAMAVAAALALLDQPAPEFGISDSVTVTQDTLEAGYEAWNETVPASVLGAQE